MQHIENDIKKIAEKHFLSNYKINTVLSPAWTTDWITESAKENLELMASRLPKKLQLTRPFY